MKKLVILILLVACVQQAPLQERAPAIFEPVPQMPVAVQPVPVFEEEVVECVDSDGFDIFAKGKVVQGDKELFDSCLSLKQNGLVPLSKVLEYVCEGDEIVAKPIDCAYGCLAGACVQEVERQFLVRDGVCSTGSVGSFAVTECFDNCLPGTMCAPAPLKTKHYTFPYQLACLVPSDDVVTDKWFEFETFAPMNLVLFADVEGSELVAVEVHDANGNAVAAPINGRIGVRCFTAFSGTARVSLPQGRYVVYIAAKGDGSEKFRSLSAKNFAIGII
jgi:hypothetical protein